MTLPKCGKCKVVSIDEAYRKYGKHCKRVMELERYKMMINYAGFIKPCEEHKEMNP